jgi:hypothetical protein
MTWSGEFEMSTDATRWAWLQGGIKPSAKLVLLSMADRAGETHECFPSIKRLCDDTNLDRKTVIRSIKALCDCGLMTDTGKRKGLTGQVIVYRLIGVASRSQTDEFEDINNTKNGTVPKMEQFPFSDETVPLFPDNSTAFPLKESQKRDTESINNLTKNQSKNLSNNKAAKTSDIDLLKKSGIDEQLANDFLKIRKAKKAPLTQTALKGIEREANVAGISIVEAVRICTERNWQTFNAKWDWQPKQSRQVRAAKQTMPRPDYSDYTPLDENFNNMPAVNGERIS